MVAHLSRCVSLRMFRHRVLGPARVSRFARGVAKVANASCRFLPLLPPITRHVKLPARTNPLQFGIRARYALRVAMKNGKNGKNGNGNIPLLALAATTGSSACDVCGSRRVLPVSSCPRWIAPAQASRPHARSPTRAEEGASSPASGPLPRRHERSCHGPFPPREGGWGLGVRSAARTPAASGSPRSARPC